MQNFEIEKRTKVSKACDYCKKRKFKCSGQAPCELCTKKDIECQFSIVDRRTIRRKNKKRTIKPRVESTDDISNNNNGNNNNNNNSDTTTNNNRNSNKNGNSFDITSGTSTTKQNNNKKNKNTSKQHSSHTFVHKPFKNDGHFDKDTLKLLNQKSKIPIHFQPLTIFPLHKVDGSVAGQQNDIDNNDDGSTASESGPGSGFGSGLGLGSGPEVVAEGIANTEKEVQKSKDHEPTECNLKTDFNAKDTTTLKDNLHSNETSTEAESEQDRKQKSGQTTDHEAKMNTKRQKHGPTFKHEANSCQNTDYSSNNDSTPLSQTDRSSVPASVNTPRALYDSGGNLRYVGESSPLSFLFECRNIFKQLIGESSFTTESDSFEVFDEADDFQEIIQVPLPNRETLKHILEIFSVNVNVNCYIFDPKSYEKNIIVPIYTNYSACSIDQIAIINLTIGVGLLYAEIAKHPIIYKLQSPQMKSSAYFEYGIYLTKKYMNIGKLWITEAFCLATYYYQTKQQRNSAWLMLGLSIRNAQALGLHRKYINESFKDPQYTRHRRKLFKSLYVLDRIMSVLLGRPLIIDDCDWDDFSSEDIYEKDKDGNIIEDIHMKALFETCKLAKIIGRAIRSFYLDGIINSYKAERVAIEVKLWSMQLPESLQVDKVLSAVPNKKNGAEMGTETGSGETQTKYQDNWAHGKEDLKLPLLMIHLSQLYAITLLSRPFYMYVIFKDKKGKITLKRPKNRQEIAMCNFTKATVKASSLIIQFSECYIDYIKSMNNRVETYALVHCLFMASLIIGLTVLCVELNKYIDDEGFTTEKLMKLLNSSKTIFCYFSRVNPMSNRFYLIVEKMQDALMLKFKMDANGHKIDVKKSKTSTGAGAGAGEGADARAGSNKSHKRRSSAKTQKSTEDAAAHDKISVDASNQKGQLSSSKEYRQLSHDSKATLLSPANSTNTTYSNITSTISNERESATTTNDNTLLYNQKSNRISTQSATNGANGANGINTINSIGNTVSDPLVDLYNFNKDYDSFIDSFGLHVPEMSSNEFNTFLQSQLQPSPTDSQNYSNTYYRDNSSRSSQNIDAIYANMQNYGSNNNNNGNNNINHSNNSGSGIGFGGGIGVTADDSVSSWNQNAHFNNEAESSTSPFKKGKTSSDNVFGSNNGNDDGNGNSNSNSNNRRKRGRNQLDEFMYNVGLNDLLFDSKI